MTFGSRSGATESLLLSSGPLDPDGFGVSRSFGN